MEIRAAGLEPSLPDRVAAALAPAPDGDGLPELAAADAIALAVIDGILVRGDGGREQVTLRLLPPALDEDPADEAPGHALAARIVGTAAAQGGPAGTALRLETALGTITPSRPFAATLGSMLRIDILARMALPEAASLSPPPPPALDHAAALGALPEAMRAGDDLAASLLLLLAAMPSGRERLRQSLDAERPAPSAAGSDARPIAEAGELAWWRASLVPWPLSGTGGAHLLRRARPAVRQDPEDAERAVRIVLELALRSWGRIQLDGLYRRRRLDLMLRSHLPLDAELREEAGRRFRMRLTAGGLAGNLAFAVTRDFPVSAAPSAPAVSLEV